MKWNIDDVPVFVAVVGQNGISAAADHLEMPKSTVSRSVTRLEESLGVRLLERNSRRLRMTSEGEAFYRHSLLIMEQVNEASAQMAGLTSVPSGRLVVALPMAFSREIVARHLNTFNQRYPHINLEIMITSHRMDIIRDQIDIAVVVGLLDDSDLVAKKLLESPLVWIAHPEYAEQHLLGETADDLLDHIVLCEKRYGHARMAIRDHDQKRLLDLSQVIHINDPIAVRKAVASGAGVSMVPLLYCRKQLENGTLKQVYKEIVFKSSSSVISAVYPSRRLISNKTRAFMDFLVEITERA